MAREIQTSFHGGCTIGLLLTFARGAMDSYTYIQYGALASAQTDNIILSIIQTFDEEWLNVGKEVLSTLFFFLGILLIKYLINYSGKKERHFWRLFVLYYEAVIFFFVSLTPVHERPALVTILIAFTASIQWVAFDKINGHAYTNLFTTGSLEGIVANLYDYCISKERADFDRFLHYLTVVLVFITGAIVLISCHRLFGAHSILIISILFLIMTPARTFQLWQFYHMNRLIF